MLFGKFFNKAYNIYYNTHLREFINKKSEIFNFAFKKNKVIRVKTYSKKILQSKILRIKSPFTFVKKSLLPPFTININKFKKKIQIVTRLPLFFQVFKTLSLLLALYY